MSCFVNWPFLGVPDIVIFVSSPLSSMMMVVLCLVCILHFSPPFPVTLPVYSLLIDIGVPDIVIFVSCPLSSMMMVVLCLVCILHFSPPFPVTLPVYSLLIDIVVVLSCSRCLVWWWLSFLWCLRCVVGGMSGSF